MKLTHITKLLIKLIINPYFNTF